MSPTLELDAAWRRARLGVRHRLAPGARCAGPEEVARSLVAVHSTDAPTVYLSCLARMAGGSLSDVERALYEERSLLRVMGMRRTVFAVPRELAPAVFGSCGRAVANRERKATQKMLEAAGIGPDPAGYLAAAEEAALNVLAVGGELKASEIAASDPMLDTTLVFNLGRTYQGKQKVASRVLVILAAEGRIVRARPVGTWRSSQYRWSRMDHWLGEPLREVEPETALTELARAWLASFGPAPVEDFAWWTGLTITSCRKAFENLDLAEADLDGTPGILLAGDAEPVEDPQPWVALLPALDSTTMGWKRRDWYLGDYGPLVFDGTGNGGPTIWCNGRIVGGWAQTEEGEILTRLFEDVGSEATAAIGEAAASLAAHIGPVRLAPRARGLSQTERDLTA